MKVIKEWLIKADCTASQDRENKMYDYLVVGSGLYGAVFAHEAKALCESATTKTLLVE